MQKSFLTLDNKLFFFVLYLYVNKETKKETKMANLRKLLRENMRRFRTKNLSEAMGSLQQSSPNENSGWERQFNSFSSQMSSNPQSSNNLFGWWLEVYSSMADQLAFYAQKLNHGYKIEEFKSEILKIAKATGDCMNKFRTINPQLYDRLVKDDYGFVFRNIKDDLIDELQDLVLNAKKLNSSQLSHTLEHIADAYQFRSESILNMSWDYAIDSSRPDNSDNINIYSQN